MSRRRTSSTGTVSLFPFLAVLVCAMGALILLLLVTTRRIRQQTIARHQIVKPESEPSADETPAAPVPAETPPPPPEIVTAPPGPEEQPILPPMARDPEPQVLKPFDPTPGLLAKLADLEREQRLHSSRVQQLRQQLTELEALADKQSQLADEQEEKQVAIATEKERLNHLYLRVRQQRQETQERADELREQIQQARMQAATEDSRFTFVPYDGHSGTTRRPIVIECTADRFTFVSEEVSLQAGDLDGFTPRYNPLLYATQALIRYWERRDRSSTQEFGEPYVMLVVRPGGTTAYYVARGLLAGLGEQFGYELVTDDQQFAWPKGTAESTAICRTLIEKMLADRDELMDVALRNGARLSDFSDSNGEFRLEEIDRLQDPQREVAINGQRFSRESRGTGGFSGDDWRSPTSSHQSGSSGTRSFGSDREPAVDRWGPASGRTGELGAGSQANADGASGGIYTRQNSAVTQADRMPEWLRDGTTRLKSGSRDESRTKVTEIDPFADLDPAYEPPSGQRRGDLADAPGRSQTYDAGARKTTAPALDPPPVPPAMLTVTPPSERQDSLIDDSQPQWGARSASGSIGFEKSVRVEVTSAQVTIGNDYAFQIDRSMSIIDVRRQLASAINREVHGWGAPPRSFYWVPAIQFVVSPGGRPHHERLRMIVREWDVRESTQYRTE